MKKLKIGQEITISVPNVWTTKWQLVVDYVIKILIFTNFRNTNWTIFVDFVIKIFIFTNFEKKISANNEQGSMNRGEKWFSEKL